MEVGVLVFATDLGMDPGALAFEVEQRGFSSMMFPEHSHIPVSRATDYPQVYGGGVLPDFYKRTYDPFISCAFAAAATTTLQIGTGVCLLALRDTVHTAKLVASVDRLSGGRFAFGVGFGWNREELVTHGADFGTRHRKVREQIQLMRVMWTDDVAEFDDEHVSLQPSWCWPKPVQTPTPHLSWWQRAHMHAPRGRMGRRLVSDAAAGRPSAGGVDPALPRPRGPEGQGAGLGTGGSRPRCCR